MRYNRPHYFLFLKPFSITNSTQTSISTTTPTTTTTTITNTNNYSDSKQIKLTNQERLLFNLKHIINVNIEIKKNNNKSYNKIGLHLIDVSLKLMNNLRRII